MSNLESHNQQVRKRWHVYGGWFLVSLCGLAILIVLCLRVALIDKLIGKALDCAGCFDMAVLVSDWPPAALALSLLVFGFGYRKRGLATLARLAAILIFLLYATDYLTSVELSSRLVFHELPNYLADSEIIGQHLKQTGFGVGLLLLAAVLLCCFLTLAWPAAISIRGRAAKILLTALLITGLAAVLWPQSKYVHSWMLQNVFQYNWYRGEMRPYSPAFAEAAMKEAPTIRRSCWPGLGRRDNLVILILESWSVFQSRGFGGQNNWTPQLDQFAQQGLAFDNFHAAGFSTNEGLMSLLTGMEVLATGKRRTPFITAWGGRSLPDVLQQQGYQTSFLTTGNLAFSRKGSWLKHIGFSHTEGHDHPSYDGLPRLHFAAAPDEALYRRALTHLDELGRQPEPQPFLVVLENVSSHHPYQHPHTGSTEWADVFGYMDKAAGAFIEALEKRDFFRDGRLLVVSDHRAMVPVTPEEQRSEGLAVMSRIPAFVLGQDVPVGRVQQPFHQADVLPSLEYWVVQQQCGTQGVRNLVDPQGSVPRCVHHVRGDRRENVNVFCPEGEGVVVLAGDHTRFRQSEGMGSQQKQQILEWINRYRIERDLQHELWQSGQTESTP